MFNVHNCARESNPPKEWERNAHFPFFSFLLEDYIKGKEGIVLPLIESRYVSADFSMILRFSFGLYVRE